MGNILTNWFQWGKTPNQNDPRNRRTEQTRDPWPPARSSEPTLSSYDGSSNKDTPTSYKQHQEQTGPTQEAKETPPPRPPPVQNVESVSHPQQEASPISSPPPSQETKQSDEALKTTCEIKIQPKAEKESDSEPKTAEIQGAEGQSDKPADLSTEVEQQELDDIAAAAAPAQGDPTADNVSPHVEGAVVKIQAGIRGYLTRKALKERTRPETTAGTDSAAIQDEEKTPEPEFASEIEPTDSDAGIVENGEEGTMDEAATRIQASFRGYKTRQELKEKHGLDGPPLRVGSRYEATGSSEAEQTSGQVETKPTTLDVKEVVQYGCSSEIQANLESRVITPAIPESDLTGAKESRQEAVSCVAPEIPRTPIPEEPQQQQQQAISTASPPSGLQKEPVPTTPPPPPPPPPIQTEPARSASSPTGRLQESSEVLFQAPSVPPPQVAPASVAAPSLAPQAVLISPRPPVQAPDDEYEYEEYTDEEEEEEEEEIKVVNTTAPRPQPPPPPPPVAPAGQSRAQPAQASAGSGQTAAQPRPSPAQQTTQPAAPALNEVWVTSSVYQSAGQNEEEDEYEEEEEEEEEVELGNGSEVGNAVAAPQQPARPVAPGPRAAAPSQGERAG